MTIQDYQWKPGDRMRGLHWRDHYITEVVRVEAKGIVCDMLSLSSHSKWRNIGHRSMYEWSYGPVEKL